jgi:antitoxin (DNA-binding transcriptional repressor) of toxin-antitoxin stability system
MRSVGIKLLKNKLSEYVRLAAGGETVLVTDRDRGVAELGPPVGQQYSDQAHDRRVGQPAPAYGKEPHYPAMHRVRDAFALEPRALPI